MVGAAALGGGDDVLPSPPCPSVRLDVGGEGMEEAPFGVAARESAWEWLPSNSEEETEISMEMSKESFSQE